MALSAHGLRVLGSLMEKEMVTPDVYPMSVNGLLSAANQRSSRDPVMDLSEDEVRSALTELETEALVLMARDGGRVAKYEHRIRTVMNLRRDETAVICLLLLRGAQTPGELRSRAERMYQFDDLAQVQATLERLAAREQPLTTALHRVPGSREVRWAQMLGPIPSSTSSNGQTSEKTLPDNADSLRVLVNALSERLDLVEQRLRTLETRDQGDAT